MSTEQLNEKDAFNAYIEERWGGSLSGTTLEEALASFRQYQRELADARAKVQAGIDSCNRGEARSLDNRDLERMFARHDKVLREEGIPE